MIVRAGGLVACGLTALALIGGPALAADNVLLIQMKSGGGFVVWHTEGSTYLTDDEALALEASAKPAGGPEMATTAGPGRAFETPDGVVLRLSAAGDDNALLVDRDNCGHVKLWHAAGPTRLSDDQIADAYMSGVPEGGPRIAVGEMLGKAFLGKLGVTLSLWPARARK